MTPTAYSAWLDVHYSPLLNALARHYGRDQAEETLHAVLCKVSQRVSTLDAERLVHYIRRACHRQRMNAARDYGRRQVAYAQVPVEAPSLEPRADVGVACERVIRQLPRGAIRTCTWLIYTCGWDLAEACASAGIQPRRYRQAFRRDYHTIRQQLAQFLRRRP